MELVKHPRCDIATGIIFEKKSMEYQTGKKRILIVEDDDITQLVLSKFLKNDYQLQIVSSGEEAIQKLFNYEFDLIIMDISLHVGGWDGIQTLKYIRKITKYKNVPVIAQTAHALKGDDLRFIEAGFDAYISKPFTRDSQLNMVRNFI